MKNFIYAALLLILLTNELKSQNLIIDEPTLVREFLLHQAAMGKTLTQQDIPYNQITGSPYYNPVFIESEIFSNDSIKYINVKLRYNIFTDQIEFIDGNEILEIANPTDFMYFIIGDDTFVHQAYLLGSSTPGRGFFKVLALGQSAALTKRMEIKYNPPELPQAYAEAKPPKFIRMPDSYFIKFPGSLPFEIPLQRRRLISVFPNKIKELENFIETNNLNFRREEDIVKLVEYYNSL